jgi:hypothetical protein
MERENKDDKSDLVTVVNGKVTDFWDETQFSLIDVHTDVSEDLSAYTARIKHGKKVHRENPLKKKLFYLEFDRLPVRLSAKTQV